MHLGLPLQEPAQPATFPERLLINSWVLELCHPLGMQFETGTWPQLEEGLPPLAGLQTQGLRDSRGGNAYYKPSRVQNLREAGLYPRGSPCATWRLMCFVQRTTGRQKGSSQTQGLWTPVVRKTACGIVREMSSTWRPAALKFMGCAWSSHKGTLYIMAQDWLWWLKGYPTVSFGNLNLSWTPGANGLRESWCRITMQGTTAVLPRGNRQSLCPVGLGLDAVSSTTLGHRSAGSPSQALLGALGSSQC